VLSKRGSGAGALVWRVHGAADERAVVVVGGDGWRATVAIGGDGGVAASVVR
jgi:hypothetical protein